MAGTTSSRTNLNHWLRVTEKKSDQVALPPDAGFGEDAFDLGPHGVVGDADRIRDLLGRMAITQQRRLVAIPKELTFKRTPR